MSEIVIKSPTMWENINVHLFHTYVIRRGPNECWPWAGGHIPGGYGAFAVAGKSIGAHRVSVVVHGKGDPTGKTVRHSCDNPGCVNPAHLTIGTQKDNMRDRLERTGYPRGGAVYNARLTEEVVREARQRYAQGETPYVMAREYGVNKGTLFNAIHGDTWAHVPGAIPKGRRHV